MLQIGNVDIKGTICDFFSGCDYTKNLMKRWMALRYRPVPLFLFMTEQGLGLSFAKPKAQLLVP